MLKKILKWTKRLFFLFLIILIVGLAIPHRVQMPVMGATDSDFNHESFWYYPWGRSGTHKGVDIFAANGTPVKSATTGLVLFTGKNKLGGNIVLVLSAKWKIHYYAHLNEIKTTRYSWVSQNDVIGTVGTSGNAAGKAPHLHYTIATFVPHFWRWDQSPQGWKKMFYDNPIPLIRE